MKLSANHSSAKKTLGITFLAILLCQVVVAQDFYRSNVEITLSPGYQSWTGQRENTVSQNSLPVEVYIPISQNSSLAISSMIAATNSTEFESLNGMTDTQIEIGHIVDALNLGFHVGIGLPTGQRELTGEAFGVAQRISQDYLNFRAASFGQGLSISPGISWALPFNASLVGGVGISWQYNGPYRPIANMPFDYKPGNEFILTTGAEMAFSHSSTLSVDAVVNFYQEDKLGENVIFQSGNKMVFRAVFEKTKGFDRFLTSLMYRSRGKNKLRTFSNASLQEEMERTTPNLIQAEALWQKRIGKNVDIGPIGELRRYDQTSMVKAITEAGGGLLGRVRLTRNFAIPAHFKYYKGWVTEGQSFSGIDIIVGATLSF